VTIYWPIASKILSFAAIAVALVTLPFSVTVCHAALIAFLILWTLEGAWREKLAVIAQSILLQVLLAFMAIQVLGMLYSDNATNGWFSLEKKIFFFLFPLALATSRIKLQPKEIRLLLYVFTAACLSGVMICVMHAVTQVHLATDGMAVGDMNYLNSKTFTDLHPTRSPFWMLFSYVRLADGINLHPSYFSLYLAFCILFLLSEFLYRPSLSRDNIIRGLVIFLFTFFIICLSTRIVVISLIIIYLTIGVYWVRNKKLKLISVFLLGLLMASAALLYLNPVSRYRNVQEIQTSSFTIQRHSFYETSAEIRASLWWLGWKSYGEVNLLIGAGTGDVLDIMEEASRAYEVTNILQTYDPHNQYLFTLIGSGLFGFLALTLLLTLPCIKALAAHDYLFLGFSFLFAMLCITETALELQKGIVFFTLVYSLLAFQRQSFQTKSVNLKFFSAES
jgi:O-antigen ligase